MNEYLPARMANLLAIAELLEIVAREMERQARKRAGPDRLRAKRGSTLRPGALTPLWNALAVAVKPHLRRRGARALLARELAVHRARIGEYFGNGTAMPDAERTLLILLWLSRQRAAPDPGRAPG